MTSQSYPILPAQWADLRAAMVAVQDASREAELAAARAKVALGEAVSRQIALIRQLADEHGFDPDGRIALGADRQSVVVSLPQEGA